MTAIDRRSACETRFLPTVMDQQSRDRQPEKMVLSAAGLETWFASFIFIALVCVSWENIISNMFDASCLVSCSRLIREIDLT